MGKKRRFSSMLILLALATTLCITVLAYMFLQTKPADNQFTPAQVSCQVEEVFSENTKREITVKNTGNIDAYLRVRLISYWVDADDKIVGVPSPALDITLGPGWIAGSDNTYYYQSPVTPNHSTGDLLGEDILLLEQGGYFQVIEVFAEAIQSIPEKAVETNWGVTIEDKMITAVS